MSGETFGSILGAVYRRRISVVLVLLGAIGAGVFYQAKIGPDYLARAVVMVPTKPPTLSLSSEGMNVPTGPYVPDMSEELRIGAIGVISSGTVHDRMLVKHPELDLRALRKNLRGNIDRYGNIEILSYAPDKPRAVLWANDFADCFQDEVEAVAESSMRHSLATFQMEEPAALARYRELHQSLVQYLGQIGTADLNEELKRLLEERRALEDQMMALDLDRVRSEAERPVVERSLEARPDFVLNKVTYRRNPAYEQALAKTRELSTQLALARLQFREGHPEVLRLQAELDFVREEAVKLLQEEMVLDSRTEAPDEIGLRLTSRLTDLDIAAAGYDTQKAALTLRRSELDARLAQIPAYLSEVALREAELNSARDYWDRLTQRRSELEFHLHNGVHFTVMSPGMRAREDDVKAVPATGGLYVFCLIAGLSGGLLYALTAEMLARMRAARPF